MRWGIGAGVSILAALALLATAILTIGSWGPLAAPRLSERWLGARIEIDSLVVFPLGRVRTGEIRAFRIGAKSPAVRARNAEISYDGLRGLWALRPRGVFLSGLEIDAVESKRLAADLAKTEEPPAAATQTAAPLARDRSEAGESWVESLQGRLPSEVRVAGIRLTGLGDEGATYGLRRFATSQTPLSNAESLVRVDFETEPLDAMFATALSKPFRLAASCRIGRGSFSIEEIDSNLDALLEPPSGEAAPGEPPPRKRPDRERRISLTTVSGRMGQSQRVLAGGAFLGGRWDLAAEYERERKGGAASRTSATLAVANVSLPTLGETLRGLGAGLGLGLEGTLSSRMTLDHAAGEREATTVTLEAAGLRVLPAGRDPFPVRPVDVRGVCFGSTRLGDPSVAPVLRGRFEIDENVAIEIEEVVLPRAEDSRIVVRHKASVSDLGRLIELVPGHALQIPIEEPISVESRGRCLFGQRAACAIESDRVRAALPREALLEAKGRAEFASLPEGGLGLQTGAANFRLTLSDLSRTSKRFGIEGLALDAAAEFSDGQVRFENGATTVTARLNVDSASGRAPGAAVVWSGFGAVGDASLSIRDADSTPSIETKGDFSVRELAAAGVRLREAAGSWRSVEREITCEATQAVLCLGRVRASARANLASWPPEAESSGNVSGLDLAVFGKEFDLGGVRLEGRVDAQWRGRRGPGNDIEFEAEVESAGDKIEIDKETVRKLLSRLPKGAGWLMAGDPLKTLDRKFKDRRMVPFDKFRIDSRYAGKRIANRLALENEYFRIALDANADRAVVAEFLRLRQQAAAGRTR